MPCELQGEGVRTRTRLKCTCMLFEASSTPAPHPASSLHRKPSPCLVVFKCFGQLAPIRQFCFPHANDAFSRHSVLTRFLQLGRVKNKTFQEFQLSKSSSTMLLLAVTPLLFLGKNQELIYIYIYWDIYISVLYLCILREFRREELSVQKANNSCDIADPCQSST